MLPITTGTSSTQTIQNTGKSSVDWLGSRKPAFLKFISDTVKEWYGPDKLQELLACKLTTEEMAQMLAEYLENRIYHDVWVRSETAQTLDIDIITLAKVFVTCQP